MPKTLGEASGEAATLLKQDSSAVTVNNSSNARGAWEAMMANGCPAQR